MQWLQITVSTTTEGSDLVASVLNDYESDGVSIIDHNDVVSLIKNKQSWDYVDDKLIANNDKRVLVNGFFHENFDKRELLDSLERLKKNSEFEMGSMETTFSLINSEDWENEWRKYYSPIKIGRTVIVPAWQKYECADGEIPAYIEPGMAFGTGKHETTSMCVSLMQSIDVNGKAVADIGCGSGILGICALSLGAEKCVFNDIDELAVKAAKENIALNKFSGAKVICGDLDAGDEKFDVVLANLTADLLLRLKEKLNDLTKIGGKIIISGIINSRADEVYSAFSKSFRTVRKLKDGEWQAMMFERV